MVEQFTQRVLRAFGLAAVEAARQGRTTVGTENILYAVLQEDEGGGVAVLKQQGMSLTSARRKMVDEGWGPPSGAPAPAGPPPALPLSTTSKRALEFARAESRTMGDNHVGVEHVLLGLLLETDGNAARLMGELGLSVDRMRQTVAALHSQGNALADTLPLARPSAKAARAPGGVNQPAPRAPEPGRPTPAAAPSLPAPSLLGSKEKSGPSPAARGPAGSLKPDFSTPEPRSGPPTVNPPTRPTLGAARNADAAKMTVRVGIVGVSGYGGGEVLRLCVAHPAFQVVYAAGESSAGAKLGEKFPGIPPGPLADLEIQKWDPSALPALDVLFASLPTGESKEALAKVPASTRIVDVGGDHRFVEGWVYGLADVWPDQIRGASRVANPGCFPAATLAALAPLAATGMIDPAALVVDAKTGVSGAGRGGGSTFGYAEVNEDVAAYGLFKHAHVPEMTMALTRIGGRQASLTFTPHLLPMTRGILSTCYARGRTTTAECLAAARRYYADRPFVRVVDKPPHSKWAAGSNLVFVSYAADPERGVVIAMGAVDNLGKGAAGQAVQNANLMVGLPETAGLEGAPLWP